MAKTYTTTIQLKCWKEHTCASCGAIYSYLFTRTITGTAANPDKSRQNAQKAAAESLECDVDLQPCPTCGIYQPDMIAKMRSRSHWKIFLLAFIAFPILLVLRATDVLRANTATWVAVIACGLAALLHAAREMKNLNSDPAANRQLGAKRVSEGNVQHKPGRMGPPKDEWLRPPRGLLHRLAFYLLLAAVMLVALPEIVRTAQHWPLNETAYPPVVGPADQTRIYMEQKISSIQGYWRGTPAAILHAPGGAATDPGIAVAATTNQKDWGTTLYVKDSEKSQDSTPWVHLQLPGDPSLAGKTYDCDIQLTLEYPVTSGTSNFMRDQTAMRRTVSLQLAPVGAGGRYNTLWWGGTVGGMALLLICGFMLIRGADAVRRMAIPTRIPQPVTPPPPLPMPPVMQPPPPLPL